MYFSMPSVARPALAQGLPVEYVGFVERDDFFDRIDCLIVPSVWPEAFGRTVTESYMRGVPVIGNRHERPRGQ